MSYRDFYDEQRHIAPYMKNHDTAHVGTYTSNMISNVSPSSSSTPMAAANSPVYHDSIDNFQYDDSYPFAFSSVNPDIDYDLVATYPISELIESGFEDSKTSCDSSSSNNNSFIQSPNRACLHRRRARLGDTCQLCEIQRTHLEFRLITTRYVKGKTIIVECERHHKYKYKHINNVQNCPQCEFERVLHDKYNIAAVITTDLVYFAKDTPLIAKCMMCMCRFYVAVNNVPANCELKHRSTSNLMIQDTRQNFTDINIPKQLSCIDFARNNALKWNKYSSPILWADVYVNVKALYYAEEKTLYVFFNEMEKKYSKEVLHNKMTRLQRFIKKFSDPPLTIVEVR